MHQGLCSLVGLTVAITATDRQLSLPPGEGGLKHLLTDTAPVEKNIFGMGYKKKINLQAFIKLNC